MDHRIMHVVGPAQRFCDVCGARWVGSPKTASVYTVEVRDRYVADPRCDGIARDVSYLACDSPLVIVFDVMET